MTINFIVPRTGVYLVNGVPQKVQAGEVIPVEMETPSGQQCEARDGQRQCQRFAGHSGLHDCGYSFGAPQAVGYPTGYGLPEDAHGY